jgi:hypothetical protein
MKSNPSLHLIKTKPIARNKVDTYSEKDLEVWFRKYYKIYNKYHIRKSRDIYNIDELGARVECLNREEVIVLIDIKELYTTSPKNRKSIIIIKDICIDRSKPLLLMIICLGQRIIES